jgi:hypothetical protein
MSREEAAAKAAYGRDHREAPYASIWEDTSEMLRADYVATETAALAAADAHDRAHGIHRITLDDATVERAARALMEGFNVPSMRHAIQEARAVLAAAVQEER